MELPFAVITTVLSPLLNQFSPDRLFANLGDHPIYKGIGFVFLGLGTVVTAIGGFLQFAEAKADHDARAKAVMRVLIVAAMLFFAPFFVKMSRDGWEHAQRETGLKPASIAWRCMALAMRLPEVSDVLAVNVSAIKNRNTPEAQQAKEAESVRAIGETLDRAGNGAMGQTLAFFQSMWGAVKNAVPDTLSVMTMASKMAAVLLTGLVKVVLVAVYFLILDIAMFFITLIACFMQILQFFLIVMLNLLLPLFVGMFALPENNPFRTHARNFSLHLLAITMWPLAWMIGHVGTIELFNAVCSSMTTANVGHFANVDYGNIVSDPAGMIAGTAGVGEEVATAVANAVSGSFIGLLFTLLGFIMLIIWEFYVVVKLPFALNNLLLTGADIISQMAAQSMGGGMKQATEGVGAMGREMQAAKVAAVATGGAAPAAAAGGAAAVLAGIGGLAQGIGGAVGGYGAGRTQMQAAEMSTNTATAKSLEQLSKDLASAFKSSTSGKN